MWEDYLVKRFSSLLPWKEDLSEKSEVRRETGVPTVSYFTYPTYVLYFHFYPLGGIKYS